MTGHTLCGAWLELAGAGIVVGSAAVLRLRGLASRDAWNAARQVAAKGPAALLAATLPASDACWAHVVRASLIRSDDGGYRDTATAKPPPEVVSAQRRRIARHGAVAAVAMAAIAGFVVVAGMTEGFATGSIVAACAGIALVSLIALVLRSAKAALAEAVSVLSA